MDSMLQDLLGGDNDDRRHRARDFVSRYEEGPIDQGYSDDEAYEHFQRVSQRVDPDTMERAAEQAFSRMDPSQRAQFAQYLQQRGGHQMSGGMQDDPRQMAGMVSRIHRENPGGLQALFGGGGGGIGEAIGNLLGGGDDNQRRGQSEGGGLLGGTMGKVALGGIAAFAMKELLGGGGDDRNRRRSI